MRRTNNESSEYFLILKKNSLILKDNTVLIIHSFLSGICLLITSPNNLEIYWSIFKKRIADSNANILLVFCYFQM